MSEQVLQESKVTILASVYARGGAREPRRTQETTVY